MISYRAGIRPDPTREQLARSIATVSSIDDVATAVAAAASDYPRPIYVERATGGWRWSLAHRGGPYPLLRTTAQFLRVDYRDLFIDAGGLPSGVSILGTDEQRAPQKEAWAMLEFAGTETPAQMKERILAALG